MALFYFFCFPFLIFIPVPFEFLDIFCCLASFPADWLSLCRWRRMIGREPLGASPYPRLSLNSLPTHSDSLSFFLSHLFTGHQRTMSSGSSIVCLGLLRCTFLRIPPPFDNPDNAAAVVDAGMNAQPEWPGHGG